jgi:amidase
MIPFVRTNDLSFRTLNAVEPGGERSVMSFTAPLPTSDASDSAARAPMTVVECVAALAEGRISSLELIERALAGIEATQPTLNAFRIVCGACARQEAEEADRRLVAGERLPLLGVPVAVKDDIDVAAHPTAFGCAGDFACQEQDCEMVRRLRAAGAVIVGKTNTPEVGLYPFTEGEAFGVTRNPWSLEHTPGGSSGGAAAAVAAGIVPAAVGSDGAGSVRIPAAWCNLVGVKPQRGRISTWPEPESFNGLTCLGPLTRTVADAALMLDVLSGPHSGDAHIPPAPPQPYVEAVACEPDSLRIGLALRPPMSAARIRLHPEILAAVNRLASTLAGLGHTVTRAEPRYGLMGLALLSRGEAGVHQWVKQVPDRALLDARTRETARLGGILARTALPLARRSERRMQRRVGAIFRDVDVVIAPTSASPPLKVGAAAGLSSWATQQVMAASCPYAWPWNVLGWPAVNIPAGFTSEGLPFGVQLLGPANSEPALLSLAAQLERVERWQGRVAPFMAPCAAQPASAP